MPPTTQAPYGEELLDKGLALIQSAQQVALTAVHKSIDTVRSVAPQAHDALAKVDLVDTKHTVDSAFEAAHRVLATQREFVGELLGAVFSTPTKPAPKKATTSAA